MRVRDLMARTPFTCRVADTMHTVANLMWEHDCGCIPVVDEAGRPLAMLTDRDLCMAAYLNGEPLSRMPVGRGMSKQLWTCAADAKVEQALRVFRERQVYRLAVVDGDGRLVGVLSLSDLARAAVGQVKGDERQGLAVEILTTLAAVKQPRKVAAPPVKAAPAEVAAERKVVLEPAPRRTPAGRSARKKSSKT